jgi:putative cell wall-binding protein
VVDALTAMGLKVERVAGDTRQATAVAIADYAVTRLGWAPDEILLANGTAFADALSAAGLAGGASAPILLTDSAVAVGGAAPAWLASHGIRRVRALGGSGALSDGIVRGITG